VKSVATEETAILAEVAELAEYAPEITPVRLVTESSLSSVPCLGGSEECAQLGAENEDHLPSRSLQFQENEEYERAPVVFEAVVLVCAV